MSEFSVKKRGRLFPYKQGLMFSKNGKPQMIGRKDVPDLVGHLFKTALYNNAQAAYVEVKTKSYPYLSEGQAQFMEEADKAGCYCAVVREQSDGSWKEFPITEKGFYHLKRRQKRKKS